ncbi:MAG: preprotein translocase subunit SecE [Collinsella sp.]
MANNKSTKSPLRRRPRKKPGLIARGKAYLASVRSEMKRVVWPTKNELVNYTVAVCASLIVVGVAIALLDLVIGQGLVLFASLRG